MSSVQPPAFDYVLYLTPTQTEHSRYRFDSSVGCQEIVASGLSVHLSEHCHGSRIEEAPRSLLVGSLLVGARSPF